MTEPRDDHVFYGVRAWTLLGKARRCREEASHAINHYDADVMSWFQDEYVRMARRANHESIRARQEPRIKWTPPTLRSLT